AGRQAQRTAQRGQEDVGLRQLLRIVIQQFQRRRVLGLLRRHDFVVEGQKVAGHLGRVAREAGIAAVRQRGRDLVGVAGRFVKKAVGFVAAAGKMIYRGEIVIVGVVKQLVRTLGPDQLSLGKRYARDITSDAI